MHFRGPVATVLAVVLLLGTCTVSSLAASNNSSPGEQSEAGGPIKPGKLAPLWNVDLGLYRLESYHKEQRNPDKLRLSKDQFKFQLVNKLNPDRDPPLKVKMTVIEERVKCAADLPEEVECEQYAEYVTNFVEPTKLVNEGRYVKLRRYRIVVDGELVASPIRMNFNMYPLKLGHVRNHLRKLVLENQLGDPKDYNLEDEYILGAYYESDFSFGDILTQDCSAFGYQSLNDTFTHENVLLEFYEQGGLLDLRDIDCSWNSNSILRIVHNFRLSHRHKFPYLYVYHSTKTQPLDMILNYEAHVKQTRAADTDQQTTEPEAYNTTVNINSSSAVLEFFNFKLDQTISNKDLLTGSETAQLLSSYLDILVNSTWNENEFLKQFKFLDLLNVTYSNYFNEDGVKLLLDIKKTLLSSLFAKKEKHVHDEL